MNAFKNLKLEAKLLLAVGAIVLTLSAASLFGTWQLRQAVGDYSQLMARDVAQDRMASDVLAHFKTQVQEWKNVLIRGKDPKALEKYWAAFEKEEAAVAAGAKALAAALPEGEARASASKFVEAHATLGSGYRKGLEAFRAAGFDATAGDTAVKGMDRRPAELISEVGEMLMGGVKTAADAANARAKRATMISASLLLASLVLGGIAAALIARSIVRPIGTLVAVARSIREGDLTRPIHVEGRDETAELLHSMREMQDSLHRIVKDVRGSVDSVLTAAGEISAGNHDLSCRTEQQAASLQETAASMEQLTGTVRNSAETARQANRLAQAASVAAGKGGAMVQQVVATMSEIQSSSSKIAEIIAVIDGIAFQTNILALNAAVEAARAGDQGRGFAVVAGEVRTLAQRSAQAAREIKSLIHDSVSKVDTGSHQVSDAGTAMSEIVAQVKRVSDLIGEITSAGMEQSSGIAQVSTAVTQMDQVTQRNAALVEESAAAAASLKDQANKLAQRVAVFKLSA